MADHKKQQDYNKSCKPHVIIVMYARSKYAKFFEARFDCDIGTYNLKSQLAKFSCNQAWVGGTKSIFPTCY